MDHASMFLKLVAAVLNGKPCVGEKIEVYWSETTCWVEWLGCRGFEACHTPGKWCSHWVFYFIDNQTPILPYTFQVTHLYVTCTPKAQTHINARLWLWRDVVALVLNVYVKSQPRWDIFMPIFVFLVVLWIAAKYGCMWELSVSVNKWNCN